MQEKLKGKNISCSRELLVTVISVSKLKKDSLMERTWMISMLPKNFAFVFTQEKNFFVGLTFFQSKIFFIFYSYSNIIATDR